MTKNQTKKIDTLIVLLINQVNNCYCFIEQNGKGKETSGASQLLNANKERKEKMKKKKE